MRFIFFKNKKKKNRIQSTDLIIKNNIFDADLPEIYRGVQIYESESDRFCTFDEDYFTGEEYPPKTKRKIIVSPPKTPPSFFVGIFCGALSVLIISGGIAFFSLFSKFGGIYCLVTVPDLTSLSENEAVSIIKNNYDCFDYSIEYKENPSADDNTIISQTPIPSTMRKLYGINGRICIKLTVNKPAEQITLPNLIGQNARDAILELKNAGINVSLTEVYSDTVKLGKIISSSHPSGSKLRKNDTIHINASLGKKIKYVTMPELIGVSESKAIALLKKEKLDISKVIYQSSPLPIGTVLSQSISGGSSVREDSKVTLTVSSGTLKD